jgi:outer membrane immunogenic protein
VAVRNYLPSAVALALMLATPVFAADMSALPWLPPAPEGAAPAGAFGDPDGTLGMHSAPATSWRGFYLGGQFSYSDANGDFSKSTQAPIAYSLRNTVLESEFMPSNWPVLGTVNHGAAGFGGFIGYNTEYFTPNAKVVLGVEANYDQASLSLVAPNAPLARLLPADSVGVINNVAITGSGSVSNLDFGTLRGRAGLDLGNFLPYAFAGFALGRADVNVTETTLVEQNPPSVPLVFTGTAGRDGEWLYGFTVGAGLDVALTHNVFLRGEYEYVQFQPVAGINLNVNTVSAGAGFRF